MTKKSKTTQTSGKPAIVFFGSGPVSAKSLELLRQDFVIEAVITKPTTLGEMKAAAGDAPIHTVTNKQTLDELIDKESFTSRVAVLIDFGIIVSQKVIDHFPLGIVNSHFSLLPDLRGADPITFAILSGQKKTGVSLMLVVEAMDEGPIIACGMYELTGQETTPDLTDALILLSDALLKKELPRYLSGDTKAISQAEMSTLIPGYPSEPTYSRKLTKDDGILDFSKPAMQLEREIRAFIDWPKSRTTIAGKDVIITKAKALTEVAPGTKPGDVTMTMLEKSILITTIKGSLSIQQLKPAGKKEMTAEAFLAGHKNLL